MEIKEDSKIVKISKVRPNDYNPKPDYKEDPELEKEFDKIKESLRVHGQVDPLIARKVQKGYEIIDGEHRYKAMKQLDFKRVWINNLGEIPKSVAKKLTLTLEETDIPFDTLEVAELIKTLKEAEDDLKGLPYTEEETERQMEMLEFDWDQFEQQEVSEKEPEEKEVECPKCGNKFKIEL